MTGPQKLIIAGLSFLVIILFASAGCLAWFSLQQQASSEPQPVVVNSQPPEAAPSPSPMQTATPVPSSTPLPPLMPSPTNTRVVVETPTPNPTATPVNCIDKITDFEASGLITNEEVETFLRDTIPLSHLDRCLKIKYIVKTGDALTTPVSGRFIPVFRHISVYLIARGYRSPQEILDTLLHEVGHNVHYNLRIDNLEMAGEWTMLYQQPEAGYVSEYARTNEYEDFAESYLAYIRAPDLLLMYSPIKYDFIKTYIFDGYEYPR